MYYGLWTDILAKSNDLKLKRLDGFISYKHAAFHKMLIDGLESCVLLVDFVMFLSAVWTLILTAPIHRASIGDQVT